MDCCTRPNSGLSLAPMPSQATPEASDYLTRSPHTGDTFVFRWSTRMVYFMSSTKRAKMASPARKERSHQYIYASCLPTRTPPNHSHSCHFRTLRHRAKTQQPSIESSSAPLRPGESASLFLLQPYNTVPSTVSRLGARSLYLPSYLADSTSPSFHLSHNLQPSTLPPWALRVLPLFCICLFEYSSPCCRWR